jgi:hypothetical protein
MVVLQRFTVFLGLFLVFALSQPPISGQELLPLPSNPRVDVDGELRRWHRVTLTFNGPQTSEDADPNPFTDYRLNVTFSNGDKTYVVPGFFAADGDAANTGAAEGNQWKVHFTPDKVGQWTYTASFRAGEDIGMSLDPNAGLPTDFDGETGTFDVAETNKTGKDFRAKGRLEYVGMHHLRFAGNGEYYLKHGADSPENFLAYVDFDGTYDVGGVQSNFLHDYSPHAGDWNAGDPTWKDDKGKNIIGALNYLHSQNINSVYFLTYNIDGGDGGDTWMWTSDDERYRFDVSKLEQWEIVFNHMDKLGIQLHVVTQEIENDEVMGGLNDIRKLYYRELVARYAHHLALIWNIGEENSNTDEERLAFAEYMRSLDPYDHPITIHTNYGDASRFYDGLFGSPYYDATSIQGDGIEYNGWAIEMRQRSTEAGHKWVVYGDEQGPPVAEDMSNIGQIIRESQWGNLMGGGAGTEWYFGYQGGFGDLQSEDWRIAEPLWQRGNHAINFFRTYLPFWEMSPDNSLVEEDALALAKPGEVYAVFLPTGGSTNLTITDGTYEVRWFNPITGGALQLGSIETISGAGSRSIGQPPSNSDQEWAVLVQNVDNVPTPTPNATSTPDITPTDTPTLEPNVEMLSNGGFEIAGSNNILAQNWKVNGLQKSKRVCNKPDKVLAYTGLCAFRFNSVSGVSGKLSQKVGAFGAIGDVLTLRLWAKGKGLAQEVRINAKVVYQDNTNEKITLILNTGTFDYTEATDTLSLTGSATKAKVVFRMPTGGGKYWVDDVSLTYSE